MFLLLSGPEITDAGLEHLEGLNKLKSLVLGDTQVTDAGVAKLKQALPECRISVTSESKSPNLPEPSEPDLPQQTNAIEDSRATAQEPDLPPQLQALEKLGAEVNWIEQERKFTVVYYYATDDGLARLKGL